VAHRALAPLAPPAPPANASGSNDVTRAGRFGPLAHVRLPPGHVVERTLPIAMLCLALIAVPLLVLEPAGLPRLRGLEKELDDVTADNAENVREVERLRAEVRELRDDPAAVERIARGELGMVRKSEVVFQFGK
jgi:cell division protein FtsB